MVSSTCGGATMVYVKHMATWPLTGPGLATESEVMGWQRHTWSPWTPATVPLKGTALEESLTEALGPDVLVDVHVIHRPEE